MDTITKAKINLFAVLRNLEDLCDMDSASREIVKDTKLSVQFNVPEVGSATIDFDNGKCTFHRGKKSAALQLFFTSAEHFNNLIAPPIDAKTGKPKTVIPIFYNVFKAGFLLNQFTKLADRLSYFLQPAADKKEELLKDPEYFKINTTLTLYTALFALCEIANSDKVGRLCAKRMCDGVIAAGIPDGPQLNITVKDHQLLGAKGEATDWTAQMLFADMQFAHDILNGNASSFGGMGSGQFQVRGRLDMLEQMAKMLNIVSAYLA